MNIVRCKRIIQCAEYTIHYACTCAHACYTHRSVYVYVDMRARVYMYSLVCVYHGMEATVYQRTSV